MLDVELRKELGWIEILCGITRIEVRRAKDAVYGLQCCDGERR